MFIDTHTHLCDEMFDGSRDEIASGLINTGVELVVENACTLKECSEVLEFSKKHKNVFCSFGIHPHFASLYNEEFENFVYNNLTNPNFVAIGEFGLDYFYMNSPKDEQKIAFVKQLKLANNINKPVVIHSRDAEADTIKLLLKNQSLIKNGVLIHCFSYGLNFINETRGLQPMFALGGAITYKKNDYSEVIKKLWPNQIVLETDCPYLSPVPLRGKTNTPDNVKFVAAKIAEVLGISIKEVEEQTTQNAKKFFRIN